MATVLFVLLATLHHDDGTMDVWVMDHAMSAHDCVDAIVDTHMLYADRVTLSCEIDNAAE